MRFLKDPSGPGVALCGLAAAALGGVHFAQWHGLAGPGLGPWLIEMPYLASVQFILSGLATIALALGLFTACRVVAGAAIVVAALGIVEYVFQVDFRLDGLLREHFIHLASGRVTLGPLSAATFFLANCGLAVAAAGLTVARAITTAVVTAATFALALLALFGFLTRNPVVYEWFQLHGGEAGSFIGFLLICLGLSLHVFASAASTRLGLRRWLFLPVFLAIFASTVGLWQAFHAYELRHSQADAEAGLASLATRVEAELRVRRGALEALAGRQAIYLPEQDSWVQDARATVSGFPDVVQLRLLDGDLAWKAEAVPGTDIPAAGAPVDQALRLAADAVRSDGRPHVVGGNEPGAAPDRVTWLFPMRPQGDVHTYMTATISLTQLMEPILRDIPGAMRVELAQNGRPRYSSAPSAYDEQWPLSGERPLAMLDQQWTLRGAPGPDALRRGQSTLPEVVLWGGIVLALLFGLTVALVQKAREQARDAEAANLALSGEVAERRQAEAALRASEEQNRLIITGVKDYAFFMLDRSGRIAGWNESARQLYGYAAEDIVGRSVATLYPDSQAAQVSEMLKSAAQVGWHEEECWHVRSDGSRYRGEDVITAIRDGTQVRGFSFVTRDATQRIELYERLQQSHDFYFSLFSDFPNLVWRSDAAGRCDFVNRAWLDYTGRTLEQTLGEGWLEDVHPDDRAALAQLRLAALEGRQPFQTEYRLRRAAGGYGWVADVAKPFHDPSDAFAGHVGSCIDITARREMESVLTRNEALMRGLTAHLQWVREEEKAHVAREVHDELGGTLTALKMDTLWLSRRFTAEQSALSEKTRDMVRLVDSALGAMRRIVTNLRPSVLDDLGLVAALRWQASEFQKRTSIRCVLEEEGEEPTVDKTIALAFFRVFQEALTNVARHAQARSVNVQFTEADDRYVLRVADDGVGLPESAAIRFDTHGLRGIQQRAESLGGHAEIGGQPGRGTTLTVWIPKTVAAPVAA